MLGLLCAEEGVGNLKNALSGILGLVRAEQDVENLNKCTFRNSGTPVRRARRRKPQQLHSQEFWDSCAEQDVGNLEQNALSKIVGLLCAEQNVGILEHMFFRNSGTPVRRTRRRKSQKMHFQEFCDSCAQNKTADI